MSGIAAFLRAIADRLSPEAFFPEDADDDEPGPRQWAGLLVLHAEGVHGCDHLADARRGLGMYDPEHAS